MEGVWVSKIPNEGELFAYPSIYFGRFHKQEISFYSAQANSCLGLFVSAVQSTPTTTAIKTLTYCALILLSCHHCY